MKEIWILLLLILTAALPAIFLFFWFRAKKPEITVPWYLVSLAAGLVSVLAAALIQGLFYRNELDGLALVYFGIFVRIALVEEASRLVTLLPIIKIGERRLKTDISFGAALGFSAGLGFALLENASYGLADINITIIRSLTAAPLHGACGIRAGATVSVMNKRPLYAVFLFASSVFIHGAYNLMIISPALPSILAVPTALAALLASLHLLKPPAPKGENIQADGP